MCKKNDQTAPTNMTPHEEKVPYPTILLPWIRAYRSTPKLYITREIDIGFSILCAFLFTILRISYRHLLVSLGWPSSPDPDTLFVSACMASFCHSSIILPGLAAALLSQPYRPCGKLSDSPPWYRDVTHAIMSYCTGYMIYDSIVGYVVETWQPGVGPVLTTDHWMFLVHHVLTSLYMISARFVGAGHMSAMILMFLGEFTAPIMNIHLILEKAMEQPEFRDSSWIPLAFVYNEQIFAFFYCIFRIFFGPLAATHLTWDLILTERGRGNVPVWLSLAWMPMCWGVLLGSIPWIQTCLETLQRGPVLSGKDEL
mmetsp:Transcript_23934/g.46411  ORF Transcript_23934/g.46411 Transcript_23934/m.46411 type:complete len:312 (-) Transcript_23934:197-1132(-)